MRDITAVVLAAGEGTRMKSDIPKVLHSVRGRPMVQWVIDACRRAGIQQIVVVVGHGGTEVRAAVGEGVAWAIQEERKGTAHAVMQARELVSESCEAVVVLYGDMPCLTGNLLKQVVGCWRRTRPAAVVVSCVREDPSGYGRIIREGDALRMIVEAADADAAQKCIKEVNAGVYCFDRQVLFQLLPRVGCDNRAGEYYLTDVIGIMSECGYPVQVFPWHDADDVLGVNSRAELAEADRVIRYRLLRELMESGVTVVDPQTTYVDAGVKVEPDTVIYPFTTLEGRTVVREGCSIGPAAHLRDSSVGAGCRIYYSVLEGCTVGPGCRIGPFSHLRPGTVLGEGVRVGNFAEIKNSNVGGSTRILHHCYLGDADVGADVNVGAGAVTVNYDGRRKYRTEIGDGAFIGCNANLIAPLSIGERAYVAAGSTVNQPVPPEALAIARARQVNKEGWARDKLGGREEARDDGEGVRP